MNVNIKTVRRNNDKYKNAPGSDYLVDRYGCWGKILEIDSEDCTVKAQLDTGITVQGIPVVSHEWVCVEDNYISGERNLPPVNSIVFILMPSGNIESGFVLCSGLFAANTELKSTFMGKNLERKRGRVLPGGWQIDYEYDSGQFVLTSEDQKFILSVKGNEATLKIDTTSVVINQDGNIQITAADGKNIEINGNANSLTAYTPLSTGLDKVIQAINIELGKIAAGIAAGGGGYTPAPVTIDITQSEIASVKAGKKI